MTDLGLIGLSLALAATSYSTLAFALGIRQRDDHLISTGRKSVHAATALLTLATLALIYALIARDFRIEYVASHTSRDLPLSYTLSALWAGQQGSVLFCAWLLSILASAVLFLHRRKQESFARYASLIIAITEGFFLALLIFVTNPFSQTDFVPTDGLGMNPFLQHPNMLWHAPLLYLGYVGLIVPFALAMGTLISGHLRDPYLPTVRRWTLLSWLCLGLGTLIGAQWASVRPAWGSYWAWDAADSASLIAWLMGTALVHSLIIQDHRQTMKLWNMALIILVFSLCISGIFLTSMGITGSVHAFVASSTAPYFLAFLGVTLIGSVLLLLKRLPELRPEAKWGHPISRQSSLLLAIVLLVVVALATLWRTLSPLAEETSTTPTAVYLNWSSALTLGLLILLMGICPFIGWRGSTIRSLRKDLMIPFTFALFAAGSLLLLGLRHALAILAFSICTFVLAGTLLLFYRGLHDRRHTSQDNYLLAFVSMIRTHRGRYGAYIVHLGIVLIVIAVTGSSAYTVQQEATLEPGASVTVGDYSLRYDDFAFYPAQGKDVAAATLSVFQGERQVHVLAPERHFRHRAQQFASEAAIRTTLKEDLLVALIDWDGGDPAIVVRVIVRPLVVWMWIGGAVMVLGTVIAVWPRPSKEILEERIEEEVMRRRQVREETPKGEITI